jgi:hypothetical protein
MARRGTALTLSALCVAPLLIALSPGFGGELVNSNGQNLERLSEEYRVDAEFPNLVPTKGTSLRPQLLLYLLMTIACLETRTFSKRVAAMWSFLC